MIYCPQCNKPLEEDSRFCDACGCPIPHTAPVSEAIIPPPMPETAQVFCPNCGTPNYAGESYCQNCGTPLLTNTVESTRETDSSAVLSGIPAKEKKGLPRIGFLIGGAAAALITLVIILIAVFSGKKGNDGKVAALYLKEDEIYYSALKNKEPLQVTSRFTEDGYRSYYASYYTAYSEDGKLLFYPDKLESGGFKLYYRNIDNPKKDPIKIDSDIDEFQVNEAATLVTYLKDNGDLVQYNLKKDDKDKLASEVEWWRVSEDGKIIFFRNDDNDLYVIKNGGDKEKLDSKSRVVHVNSDFSCIYYRKDENLYKRSLSKNAEKEKIASDVSAVLRVYDTGEIYYLETGTTTSRGSYMDYVDEDMTGLTSWDTAFWIRETLSEDSPSLTVSSLYYFDGKKATLLTDEYIDYKTTSYDYAAVAFYTAGGKIEKTKLSEIESSWDFETMIDKQLKSGEMFLAVGATLSSLDEYENPTSFTFEDEKTVYFIHDEDDDSQGDLVKLTLNGGLIKKDETVQSDVYSYWILDGKVLYFTDVKGYTGDMYLGGKRIAYDVKLYPIDYSEDTKALSFYTDWDDRDECGTLNIYKGGKITKIADEVADYFVLPDGSILFLNDVSSRGEGTLYRFKGSRSTKIDDDVTEIIHVS